MHTVKFVEKYGQVGVLAALAGVLALMVDQRRRTLTREDVREIAQELRTRPVQVSGTVRAIQARITAPAFKGPVDVITHRT